MQEVLSERLAARFEPDRAQAHLRTLCASEMQGRWPGSAGERLAAAYLEEALRALNAKALAGHRGYRDPFEVVVPELRTQPLLVVQGRGREIAFEHLEDFGVNVQGAAGEGSANAETIWLGSRQAGLESAAVRGRVAVVSAGASPYQKPARGLQAYLELHRHLRDAGAVAVLRVVSTTIVRKVMSHLREEPCLPSLDVTPGVVAAAFGRYPPERTGTRGQPVRLEVPLVHRSVQSAGNVAACLGAESPGLVLMAHYDHLGTLPDGRYFCGASDNAAGVAVVLEVSRVLQPWLQEKKRSIVVLMTSAEEVGLNGATRFVAQNADWVTTLAAVVNVDEVGGSRRDGMHWLCSDEFPQRDRVQRAGLGEDPLVVVHPLRPDGFSDAAAFLAGGMRRVATVFARSRHGQVAHTLDDTPERIEAAQLGSVGRSVLRTVARLLA